MVTEGEVFDGYGWLKTGMFLVAFAGLNFVAVLLGFQFFFEPENQATLWPSSGLVMGALMVSRVRAWPLLILAAILSLVAVDSWMYGQKLLPAVIFALNSSLESIVGAFLVRRVCGGVPDLRKLSHVLCLVTVGALVGTFFTAAGGAGLNSAWSGVEYWPAFQLWWFSDILGVLIVAPVVLAVKNASTWSFNFASRRLPEWIFLLGGLLFIVQFVFSADVTGSRFTQFIDQPYIVFPFLLWAALRFGPRTVSTAMLITAFLVVHYADLGLGPFIGSGKTTHEIILSVQVFLAILVFSSLITQAVITERKRAIELLQERETHWRTLINTLPDLIWLKDADGVYLACNPSFVESHDTDEAMIIGHTDFDFLDRELAETFREQDEEVIRLNQPRAYHREIVDAANNKRLYFETFKVPMYGGDGQLIGVLSISRDVSEMKRLTRELKEHGDHLEELVKERTAQLSEARQRAESANLEKSAFLANMSHEIRTPMNAILGLTHLLQQANPTPEQARQLQKIDLSAEHLLSIINDILDLSKIEAGRLALRPSDFSLDSIIEHVHSMFAQEIESKNLTINVDCGEVPSVLRGDQTRLAQALFNYVGNAIKFTDQGSVTLRVREIERIADSILLRFEVQDTGIGIEADKLPGLFEAFKQADVSITDNFGGTGLGLVITKRLAYLMGGEAGVESEPGKGSTFWFTARFGYGQRAEPEEPKYGVIDAETLLLTRHAGARILLVEDNSINREVAVALLIRVGLVVDTAQNGARAVEMVRASAYDLVLMDVRMPVMDGLEATRAIRSMPGFADLHILAMTANVFEEDRKACLEAGMNDFIAKPIDPVQFFSVVFKWMSAQQPEKGPGP